MTFLCNLFHRPQPQEVAADVVALKRAADTSLKGVLAFCEEPLVSIDFVGNTASATVDAPSTMVMGKRLVKVVAWYDNEMGFSSRMIDVCELMASRLGA